MNGVALLAFVAVVLGAVLLLLRSLQRRATLEYQATANELRTIANLPLDDAVVRATQILEDGTVFRCVEKQVDPSGLDDDLGPALRDFFSRFERVETVAGPLTVLERAGLRRSASPAGLLIIGRGMQATDTEYDVASRAHHDEVVELHSDEKPDPTFGTYPSIYHFLIALAGEAAEMQKHPRV